MHTSARQDMLHTIQTLVAHGGPTPDQYASVMTDFSSWAELKESGLLTPLDFHHIREALGDALSLEIIQGFVYHQPHGYAGDYELLERLYHGYIAPSPHLANWDRWIHAQAATRAVRNRVGYFREHIRTLHSHAPQRSRVLNLASGPARDLFETFTALGPSPIHVDCVEQDRTAISYAQALCAPFLAHLTFIHRNVLRFLPEHSYQLIWSAGLFDYFSDALFTRVLRRLLPCLAPQGKMIIGNFSNTNPSHGYMDLLGWHLHHRSATHLHALAQAAGVSPHHMWVDQEPEGVNLFLHIIKA